MPAQTSSGSGIMSGIDGSVWEGIAHLETGNPVGKGSSGPDERQGLTRAVAVRCSLMGYFTPVKLRLNVGSRFFSYNILSCSVVWWQLWQQASSEARAVQHHH